MPPSQRPVQRQGPRERPQLGHPIEQHAIREQVQPLWLAQRQVLLVLALPQQLGHDAGRVRQRVGARGRQMGRRCSTNDS